MNVGSELWSISQATDENNIRTTPAVQLLKRLAIVLYPTGDVPALRVVGRPVDDAALLVLDILAIKANAVAYLQSVNSRSEVDVV